MIHKCESKTVLTPIQSKKYPLSAPKTPIPISIRKKIGHIVSTNNITTSHNSKEQIE